MGKRNHLQAIVIFGNNKGFFRTNTDLPDLPRLPLSDGGHSDGCT
jgi:hypothetical protein